MMMQERPKVLVLDDDTVWLDTVPAILEDDCEVLGLPTIDQGLQILENQSFDIILLDLNFANDLRTGLDIFRRIHALGCGADVVVISGETRPERLVDVFNAGVTRFIAKPATPDRIRTEVRRLLTEREAKRMAYNRVKKSPARVPFLGVSQAMQRLRDEVELLLKGNARDILILGETGTGKEVLARYIAARMDRSGRFLPVHCGAIADGLIESELFGHVRGAFTGADRDRVGVFEAAAGGIVFLDEIGEMPMHQQAKLLRVLQERKVQRVGTHEERPSSFRAIAATHVDLKNGITAGKFREDLYYRIAQNIIRIPSLRERIEDLPMLVDLFLLDEAGKPQGNITDGALALLASYEWPGNVRELEAVIKSLVCRAENGVIREKDVCGMLPNVAAASPGLTRQFFGAYTQTLIENERKRFKEALIKSNGYRDEAAKLLGLSRATFFRRAKELGLVNDRRRGFRE